MIFCTSFFKWCHRIIQQYFLPLDMECLQSETCKGALQSVNWRIQVDPFVYTMSQRSARSRRRTPKFRFLIFRSRAQVLTILSLSWKPVANFMASMRDPILLKKIVSQRIFKLKHYISLYLFVLPVVGFIFCLISFHAFLDLVALWPLCSCCLKTQPLIRCNHYRKKLLMEIWFQSRWTLHWMFIQVFYPQQQVCVNTSFIDVYFYDSLINSISATWLLFHRWRRILSHLNFC